MNKPEVVAKIFQGRAFVPSLEGAEAFAPINIALCKYWGKRNTAINLPAASSLSVSLPSKGTRTYIKVIETAEDKIFLNGQSLDASLDFSKKLTDFLNLFRYEARGFEVHTESNIPISAGLASSASGFAALVLALDKLYNWRLSRSQLSILSRLGSGSACRSLWTGFVEWQAGQDAEGMDSHGVPLTDTWPDLCLGLLVFAEAQKAISSRVAMQHTVATSPFYKTWPSVAAADLATLKQAIALKDFEQLGFVSEANAMAMHALMLSARPSVLYARPETVSTQHAIWAARNQGLSLYFTQDAGYNLKLLFLGPQRAEIEALFPHCETVKPFVK